MEYLLYVIYNFVYKIILTHILRIVLMPCLAFLPPPGHLLLMFSWCCKGSSLVAKCTFLDDDISFPNSHERILSFPFVL